MFQSLSRFSLQDSPCCLFWRRLRSQRKSIIMEEIIYMVEQSVEGRNLRKGESNLVKNVGDNTGCSHGRAHEIFTESILSACKFKSFPCDDFDKFQRGECLGCGINGCGEAGFFAEDFPLARGKHYLTTFDTAPYCGNFYYHLFIKHSSSQKKTKGNIELKLKGNNGVWTRPFSVFGRDTNEIGYKDVYKMVVFNKSEKELDGIAGIEGLYKRRTGMFSFFSRASKTLVVDSIALAEVGANQTLVTTQKSNKLSSGKRFMFSVKQQS